ncbi:MAG: hypothetical protein ACE5KZ_10430 [Candidatus Scalinduaceae bacterium]
MKRLTPIKAIRAKCKDCCANQLAKIRKCQITDCPLHPYRMGKRPKEESEQIEAKATR